MSSEAKAPTRLTYSRSRRELDIEFEGAAMTSLSAEFLRVHSPSAEVQGHGPGQAVLQYGKAKVAITEINPVGHYAIQITFDDGHSSGLFTWSYLAHLTKNQDTMWQAYLARLSDAKQSRHPDTDVIVIQPSHPKD